MNRERFEKTGKYDEQMDIWGGENFGIIIIIHVYTCTHTILHTCIIFCRDIHVLLMWGGRGESIKTTCIHLSVTRVTLI